MTDVASSFPRQRGEMADLIRSFDWSASTLGPISGWSPALKASVSLTLSASMPMFLLWGETGVMIYNEGYREFAGRRHPQTLGRPARETWPEVADFNDHVIEMVMRRGGTLAYRDQPLVLARNGVAEDVWLNLDYTPVVNEEGVAEGVLGIVKETTARIHIEQRLRVAQEAGGVGTFEWYPETGLLDVSDEYRRIWGLDADVAVTDQLLVSLIHPDDRGSAGTTKLASANPLEYSEYRRVDPRTGEIRWIARKGEVVSSPGSEKRRFLGVSWDVTERKMADEAVRQSEATFRNLAQSMPNHVWTSDAEGKLDWVNDRIYAYGGAKPGSLNRGDWGSMVHPDDLPAAAVAWNTARSAGSLYEAEFRLRAKDGTYRWHIARAVPIFDASGVIERWIGTNTDIEAQKVAETELAELAATLEQRVEHETAELLKTQEALRQSQKMESLGKLTGGVAHDFNNLLQVVSGNLQLLAKDIAGNERAERRASNALAGVSRGAKLASQLLAFGRRQALEPKVVNIGRAVSAMDDMLRRAIGDTVEIETVVSGGLWNTFVDPAQIENAVLNLAINARDAMDGDGKLTIELGNAYLDDAYARSHDEVEAGQYVLLAVTDTGAGMSPDLVAQVFEPFFSTKPQGQGTGLGLSMVYGFVKQSGGHVKIYSELGQGTTVKLYLPRVDENEDVLTALDSTPVVGGTETILVAEDDEEVRTTVVDMLSELGYRVLKAKDADSALTVIESGMAIDMLFTDVVMPGTLRSPDLARKARERLPDIAVLFTSGYTENAIVHGGRLDAGVELLGKPYTREALARKVRHILANRAQRLSATSAPARPAYVPAPPPKSEALMVLLVEDDELIRPMAAEFLQDLGHIVIEAADAEEASAALETTAIDILVTDLGLPGISGGAFAEKARALRPGIGIVFATGDNQAPDIAAAGAAAILLQKPYDSAGLAAALRAATPVGRAADPADESTGEMTSTASARD